MKPPEPVPVAPPEPAPEPEPVVAAEVDAAPIESAPALIAAVASESVSLGPGLDSGAGGGRRGGNGLDDGVGLGPGKQRGSGGDLYTPGNGSSPPTLRYAPRPNYTPEAMVRHIRGEVASRLPRARHWERGEVRDRQVTRLEQLRPRR